MKREEGLANAPLPVCLTGRPLLNPSRPFVTSFLQPATLRRGLLLAWAVLVALITLLPGAEGSIRTSEPFLCLFCGSRGTADAILNLVFFMPLGFLLAPRHTLGRVALVGFALSGGIELAQELLPGRYPTLGDLVWNGSGALLGAGIARLLARELGVNPVPSPRVTLVALALPLLYLSGAGALLVPVATDAQYFGQWTADLDFMPVYEGEALEIESTAGPVPDGPMREGGDLRMEGSWFLSALIEKGPPPTGPAPIASIYDSEKREIALLGAHREDLVWRERTRAAALRFDAPDRRFFDALAGYVPGDTLRIEARGRGEARCLVVDARQDCGSGVTPGRSWGLLLFLEGPSESRRRVVDVAWMATLFVLIGVLGGSLARTGALTAAGAIGVLAAVTFSRLFPPTGAEWAGLIGGVLAGVALRPILRFLVQSEDRHTVLVVQPGQVGVDPTEAELP